MKIGIDARFLTHPQRGGFKSYTRTVISALAEVDRENEYILYTDRPSDTLDQFPPNFTVSPVTASNAMTREQFVLPAKMRRDGIDIAHFPCNTAPIFSAPRFVVTLHDVIALRKSEAMNMKQKALHSYWRTVIPRVAINCKRVITGSEHALDDILNSLDMSAEKFRIVPIAISKMFNAEAVGERPNEIGPCEQFIMSFAAMDGRKNHPTTIEAFRRIRGEFPNLRLALVCSHANMREQLQSLGEERVVPLGPVSTDELIWLYRNAQAMVFPSLDEGFGLPPLEALACGTPVIASNSGSLPEVLGDAASLVDSRDTAEIADQIRNLLNNTTLKAEMRARGIARAQGFTHESMGKQLMAVYREALG